MGILKHGWQCTIPSIQKQIHVLESYCEGSELNVNTDKTKVVVFRNGGNVSRKEKWHYRVAPFYKYLDVCFTSRLRMHINYISLQAMKFLSAY